MKFRKFLGGKGVMKINRPSGAFRAKSVAVLSLALGSVACERDPEWELPFVRGEAVGLQGSVAVIDEERDELMMLTSPSKHQLSVDRLRIGRNIVRAVPSQDRELLLVLSRGVVPRLQRDDERPMLTVVSGGTEPRILSRYQLDDPLRGLAVDPDNEWAVAYEAEGAVINVNELMLVHLAEPEADPIPITIQSSGGTPRRFTFTSPLTTPAGDAHRLLIVETERDLSIIDLANPTAREVNVPLPSTARSELATPAQVVFHDDLPGDEEVASYLAVRLGNDSSVVTLRLGPPDRGEQAFSLVYNILDAGALPSKIEFVQTDRGLRLAALVPARREAVLFDPATSKSERVQFEQPYTGLARVTGVVADRPQVGDVALLYSETAPSIAFWRLGEASSTPYASFDDYPVESRVGQVIDVPGEEFAHLKLLTAVSGNEFFLLDLRSRLSHPMRALGGFALRLAPDGQRAWAFPSHGMELAQLNFADKHPATVAVERPVLDVFDIARRDGSGRSLLALHGRAIANVPEASWGTDLGATLFDAQEPDSADTRFFSGLMLEGW